MLHAGYVSMPTDFGAAWAKVRMWVLGGHTHNPPATNMEVDNSLLVKEVDHCPGTICEGISNLQDGWKEGRWTRQGGMWLAQCPA